MSDVNLKQAQEYLYEVHLNRPVAANVVEPLLRNIGAASPVHPNKPGNSVGEDAQIIAEHLEYLQDLVRKGVVIFFGRTLNKDERPPYGIVIFAAASDEEARRIMEDDPAVKLGLAAANLYPFQIVGRG